MKVELNLPKGSKQRLFLDFLNSQLRRRTSGYTGAYGYSDDGTFESTITGPFSIDQEEVPITWRIVKSAEGILLYIEAICAEENSSEVNWETATQQFINSVFAATLAERKNKYFRRFFFNYIGTQIDGEYWLQKTRFAPVWPDDDQPHLINAERVVSIDIEVDAIDEMDAMALAGEIAKRQAARLSLLLNVGLYQTSSNSVWVIPSKEIKTAEKAERLQRGFWGFGPQLTEMPKKGTICPLGKYAGSFTACYRIAGELLSLPPQARKILKAIDSSDLPILDSFDRSARLYQVAAVVGAQFPSVGLAYRVAAVEAISKADQSCHGFSEFVRKYVRSVSNIDSLLEYLYGSVRSAHFHAGSFPLGEFDGDRFFDPLMDSEQIQNTQIHRMCFDITREAIVNWISDLLPDEQADIEMIDGCKDNNG
jgi:hypothetical protein